MAGNPRNLAMSPKSSGQYSYLINSGDRRKGRGWEGGRCREDDEQQPQVKGKVSWVFFLPFLFKMVKQDLRLAKK